MQPSNPAAAKRPAWAGAVGWGLVLIAGDVPLVESLIGTDFPAVQLNKPRRWLRARNLGVGLRYLWRH